LKDVKVDLNTLNEEQRKEIEDKCFATWVAEIDPDAKSSEITDCLKIFNEVLETYSELPSMQ